MLKIFRHCLAVAVVVAPVMAMAESGVKDIMNGVKSIPESTMEAVDMSIGFLEKTLDDETVTGVGTQSSISTLEERMFEDLAALEGADLRRLDSFLRNKEADKILGNLYRITTNQGHVKWVCFDHYKETYRRTALTSFSQSIEAAGGVYDPHFRKISISLTSSTTAKDFFRRLVNQAPAIDVLDVSLDWKFGSADLVMIVDMPHRTNVKIFNLDFRDLAANTAIASLRPGKGRYHSLLGLLSNTKLQGLCYTNLLLLSARTSDLPSSHSPSLLQSFRFLQEVAAEDNARLTNILHHCPGLADVRLDSTKVSNKMDSSLQRGLCSLKKLQSLHLYNVDQQDRGVEEDNYFSSSYTMRDLYFNGNHPLSSNLIHVDPSAGMSAESINHLASILPELNLVHFGTGCFAKGLLKHVNISSLKSLSVLLEHRDDPQALIDYLLPRKDVCQIDSSMLRSNESPVFQLGGLLNHFPLKRLFLSFISKQRLETLLASLNVSRLQLLSIYYVWYCWTTERIVAERMEELPADLTVELGYYTEWVMKKCISIVGPYFSENEYGEPTLQKEIHRQLVIANPGLRPLTWSGPSPRTTLETDDFSQLRSLKHLRLAEWGVTGGRLGRVLRAFAGTLEALELAQCPKIRGLCPKNYSLRDQLSVEIIESCSMAGLISFGLSGLGATGAIVTAIMTRARILERLKIFHQPE
ncbi:hypothetical protein KI688_000737 [Linnemannia hyalina]|uniref:Uncharacterized protein n=1 Tax=Linnemannia hyalina TaxID=64524 RepID=A0A9P8BYY0_9FUNG|nr:hypothetical protein KI688_000737 [Linnemannia hyalina]